MMMKMTLLLLLSLILNAHSQNVYFNEIRANDDGTDDGEYIEIRGPAGFDISDWQIIHYNGTGPSEVFTFTFPAGTVIPDDNITDIHGQNIGFLVVKRTGHAVVNFDYEWGNSSLQNGPDGLALLDNAGQRIQALTWNGSADLAGGEPAWRDIGSDQNSDFSLSAPDSCDEIYNKSWDYVAPTPGMLNSNQGNGDISLPVQLSSFRVTGSDGRVDLTWTTESELDNQGFIIERSLSANEDFMEIASYESVESLLGAGNSSEKRSYHFTDTSVFNGTTYWYRLIDVSVNGVRTIHPPLSALPQAAVNAIRPDSDQSTGEKPETFRLYQNYPNPFNPVTNINYHLPFSRFVELSIYNILGQKITTLVNEKQTPGNHLVHWDASDYAAGTYYYQLAIEDRKFMRKMVLLK